MTEQDLKEMAVACERLAREFAEFCAENYKPSTQNGKLLHWQESYQGKKPMLSTDKLLHHFQTIKPIDFLTTKPTDNENTENNPS